MFTVRRHATTRWDVPQNGVACRGRVAVRFDDDAPGLETRSNLHGPYASRAAKCD